MKTKPTNANAETLLAPTQKDAEGQMAPTSRPWYIHRNSNGWSIVNISKCIALTTGPDDGESKANARLIAAAPDLLEACKQGYEMMMEGGDRLVMASVFDRAVAKAEGREPPSV